MHRDYPDHSAEFKFKYIRPISFTMMIETPKLGAGMNYWDNEELAEDIRYFQAFWSMDKELRRRVELHQKYFEYKLGELVIHDGQTLHQVANMVPVELDEHRISLQGHGVLTDKGYMLYF